LRTNNINKEDKMKKVRRNVYETNSSSTHSICVTKNNILDKKQSHIEFTIGEFGWERERYYTPYEKAQYLYTGVLANERLELIDNIKSILDSNNISYEFEEPQFEKSTWNGKDYQYLKYGYIDHSGDLGEFLDICTDENKLMKYLFSSESFIVTGNDNDDYDVEICVGYDHDEYYKGN
jgi:hypothetical protein